jgi:His/Glu/Gln/Arg/opine family amino acid ABC transporter permease subunit
MAYDFDLSFLSKYWGPLLHGALMTGEIFVLSLICSTMIAIVAALCRLSQSRILRTGATAYVEFVRGTPLLAQLVWGYFVLPIVTGIELSAVATAVIILSLHIGAYNAENFRAGIASVRKTQIESARSVGMSKWQTFKHVTLLQAAVSVAPPFLNYTIILLKATSLVSIIGTPDFLYRINEINQVELRSVELYTFAGLAYLVVLLPLNVLAVQFERRLRRRWQG